MHCVLVYNCAFRNCSAIPSRFAYSVPRTADGIHTNVQRRSAMNIRCACTHALVKIDHLLAFYRQSLAVSHHTCATPINLILYFFSLLLRTPGRMTTHSDTEKQGTRLPECNIDIFHWKWFLFRPTYGHANEPISEKYSRPNAKV